MESYEQAGLSEQASAVPQQIYDAAVDCTFLLNREVIDIWQRNLNSSFGLLWRLAGARSLGEIVGLQAAHFGNQNAALIGQAEEFAALIIKTTINVWRSSIPGRQ